MEPGNRNFKALVIMFGEENRSLGLLIREKVSQLVQKFSQLNPEKEWLQGEGTPDISVCQANVDYLGHKMLHENDCLFLVGDINSDLAFKIRENAQKKEPYEISFFVFLLPTKKFMPGVIFERETHICESMKSYLDGQLIASFVHDLCAFLMFPNQISADGVQYYGIMGGKRTCLTYKEFNPEDPHLDLQIKPKPESLFAVLYLNPKHELNEIASKLIDALEKQTANYWFSDVLMSGKNKIMCLHN